MLSARLPFKFHAYKEIGCTTLVLLLLLQSLIIIIRNRQRKINKTSQAESSRVHWISTFMSHKRSDWSIGIGNCCRKNGLISTLHLFLPNKYNSSLFHKKVCLHYFSHILFVKRIALLFFSVPLYLSSHNFWLQPEGQYREKYFFFNIWLPGCQCFARKSLGTNMNLCQNSKANLY